MMKKMDFEITSVAWHEIEDKIDVATFEDVLNTNLQLSDYGNGIEKVFFVFLAIQAENKIHENNVEYDLSEKKVSLHLKLSYTHLENAPALIVKRMMATLFLESINLYHELEIEDFKVGKFYGDAEKIFFKKGWLDFGN